MPYKDPERQRAYQRERNAGLRTAFFAGKQCARCGSTSRLELDHIDPATKVHHAIWSWSAERRATEIAKCQVLCHDCHAGKTALDINKIRWGREGLAGHGTYVMYQKYDCRCGLCRLQHRNRARTYRAAAKGYCLVRP